MKQIIALVAVVACGVCLAEREPDLRVYKSFYRGGGGASAKQDASGESGRASNVGQRAFPVTATSSGGQQGTFPGAFPGGQGSFPGTAPKASGTSFEINNGKSHKIYNVFSRFRWLYKLGSNSQYIVRPWRFYI